jgi:hypothetical protein
MRAIKAISVLSLALLITAGCSPSGGVGKCPDVLYVSLPADGTILIDGEAVAQKDVAAKIESLKPTAKSVVYYREDAQGKPNYDRLLQIEAVLTEVAKLHLPLSLSSKPDFSDTIDAQGKSTPVTACPGQAP